MEPASKANKLFELFSFQPSWHTAQSRKGYFSKFGVFSHSSRATHYMNRFKGCPGDNHRLQLGFFAQALVGCTAQFFHLCRAGGGLRGTQYCNFPACKKKSRCESNNTAKASHQDGVLQRAYILNRKLVEILPLSAA